MLDRYNNRKPSTGTLYLTATYLIFVDPDAKKETWVTCCIHFTILQINVAFVQHVAIFP